MIHAGIQLLFGQVRHARLRPVAHHFAYRVFYLRVALRSLPGRTPSLFSVARFNLLSFNPRDHGDGSDALLPWLEGVLRANGVHDADGEIALQAFPRVLGYVFNPVSFYFCHRRDGALRAILCEVRNTFGEKHFYLLDQAPAYGIEMQARKVFHVSPFCAIEGGYRFRFMRGGDQNERHVARIVHDDAEGPLIETSISGNAEALTNAAVLRAFFGYPLLTAGVVARIHWQALRLWLRRVPFFSKPALPEEEISR